MPRSKFRLLGKVGNKRLIIDLLGLIRFIIWSPYLAYSAAVGTRLIGRRARLIWLYYIGAYIGGKGGTPV